MTYRYEDERSWLFTRDGTECLIQARDNALRLLASAGAFALFAALKDVDYKDTFKGMAIIDYLVERGDIREVTPGGTWGQRRVFVRGVE